MPRESLADRYIAALELVPVFVVATDAGARVLRRSPDNARAILRTFHCTTPLWADALAYLARQIVQRERTAPDAAASIEREARTCGIVFRTQTDIEDEAMRAVRTVEERFSAMQAGGQLRALNKSYRLHRLALVERGQPAPPYSAFVRSFKADMVAAVARESRRRGSESPSE